MSMPNFQKGIREKSYASQSNILNSKNQQATFATGYTITKDSVVEELEPALKKQFQFRS